METIRLYALVPSSITRDLDKFAKDIGTPRNFAVDVLFNQYFIQFQTKYSAVSGDEMRQQYEFLRTDMEEYNWSISAQHVHTLDDYVVEKGVTRSIAVTLLLNNALNQENIIRASEAASFYDRHFKK